MAIFLKIGLKKYNGFHGSEVNLPRITKADARFGEFLLRALQRGLF